MASKKSTKPKLINKHCSTNKERCIICFGLENAISCWWKREEIIIYYRITLYTQKKTSIYNVETCILQNYIDSYLSKWNLLLWYVCCLTQQTVILHKNVGIKLQFLRKKTESSCNVLKGKQ